MSFTIGKKSIRNILDIAKEEIKLLVPYTSISLEDGNFIFKLISEIDKKQNIKSKIILPNYRDKINIDQFQSNANIEFRFTQSEYNNTLLLIADKAYSLTMEISNSLPKIQEYSSNKQSISNQNTPVLCDFYDLLWKELGSLEDWNMIEKAREDFVNLCAHEIRTPIHPILFLSNLLSEKMVKIEDRQMIEIINKNARILSQLADDLLDVTKIESNTMKLQKQRLNINEFLHDVIEEYKENKKFSEPTVTNKTNGNKPQIDIFFSQPHDRIFFSEADRNRLRQILYNLLNNAFNSDKGTGEIHIYLKEITNDTIEISIEDNGHPIDKELLPKLFSKAITGDSYGNGLGLYICRKIIELHGGRIWAENNTHNKGATFYFTIPIISRQDLNFDQVTSDEKLNQEIKYRSHVLLVGANDRFGDSLTNALERYGLQVNVIDEASVLKEFVSGYYLIAIIDMMNERAFEIAQALSKLDYKIRIYFLTSGGTNYEPLREIYNIPGTYKFIKKHKNVEKIISELGIVNVYDAKI